MAADKQDPEPKLQPFIDALLNNQKRLVDAMGHVATRMEYLTTEIEKSSRQSVSLRSEVTSLRNDVTAFRADAAARSDAIANRLNEIEQVTDRIVQDIHGARTGIIAQQNEILNALHTSLTARADLED